MKQALLQLQRLYRQSFENFIIGDNSESVCALVQLVSSAQSMRFIYLFGPEKSGKTHLLKSVARRSIGSQYFDVNNDPDLRGASINSRLLVIDNVEALNSEGEVRLFNLFNALLRSPQSRWLLSGKESPLFLKLRSDLRTRIATAMTYRLVPLSEYYKISFLHSIATERGIQLSDPVIRLILSRASRDISSLIYCVQAIDQVSLELKKPITVHLVRQVLSQLQ